MVTPGLVWGHISRVYKHHQTFALHNFYLHDDTGHDVLERLLELRQTRKAGLNYPVGPLVHLGVLKSALLQSGVVTIYSLSQLLRLFSLLKTLTFKLPGFSLTF